MKIRPVFLICGFTLMAVLCINNLGIAMTGRPYDYYRKKLKDVDHSDGISRGEAIIIAQNDVIDGVEKGEAFVKKIKIARAKIFEDSWYVKRFPDDWVVLFPMKRGLSLIGSSEYITFVNKKTGKVVRGGERK